MKKTTYALITLGIVIVLGIGVLIGMTINNNIKNMNEQNINNASSNNVDVPTPIIDYVSDMQDTINAAKDKVSDINNTIKESNNNVNDVINELNTTNTDTTYSTKDNDVINTLKDTLNNIKNSEVTENFTKNAKKTFIDVVDFIFYGGTIKGHTFEELTSNGKSKVLEIASNIDDAIEAKVPGYKESISSGASKAFKEASRLIKKGSSNLNSFLQEKLSEENYNAIIDAKDDLVYYSKNAVSFIKDNAPKLFNTVKEKLSSWYQKYKNS